MSRREFLRAWGRTGLAALALSTGAPALVSGLATQRTSASRVREVRLEAGEVTWELAPGKIIKALAYNGRIPGPELRLNEGERVRVILKNSLPEPTTIHWHGVDVPNAMDGVPGVTQQPVQPGEAFVYEFDACPAGTRWYHTHFREHRQLDRGLYAPLIIEPIRDAIAFDRDYTLVLDDWATGSGRPVPGTEEGVANARPGSMMGGMGRMMQRMGGMMGGGESHAYDTMTINGKAYPATRPLDVRKGERVRLRLINASADHTHVIRLDGHRLGVSHTDGNPLIRPVEVEAVPIAPSERYDVLFVANRPGAWFLHCLQPGHAEAGEQVLLVYAGHEGAPPTRIEASPEAMLWRYGLGSGRGIPPRPSAQERAFDLVLSGGMMGSDVWTIDGKSYPNTDPVRVRKGDVVRVRLTNMSIEAHPMHLHGQSFKVLAVNGRRLLAPIVKDSVDVAPHMGSVDIEFTADNPGAWLFHCHKPMHMDGGMATLVRIG